MKRLPTTHRKTPLDKNESSPNFYELSEKSPLPENVWLSQGGVVGRGGMVMGSSSTGSQSQPQQMGMTVEGYAGMMGGGMGGGLGTMSGMNMNSTMQQMMQQQQQQQMMGHPMSRMMPGMGMMSGAPFAYPPVNPAAASAAAMGGGGGGTASSSSAVASTMGKHLAENETLLQLQRENDTLMRQLLQLQNQMNPQTNVSANNSAENNAAVTALRRDNELLIRQVMELQEQLPQELRMTVPVEMLGTSTQQQKKVVEGKSEEKSDDVLEKV